MINNKYDDEKFFSEYSKMARSLYGLHWPVDNYFYEGKRQSNFLGEGVVKYHKTLTTYINGLLKCGFEIKEVIEPMPPKEMLEEIEGMKEELRRPMMLLISVRKISNVK